MADLDYNAIQAHVQELYMPGFADNTYDSSAFLSTMRSDGRMTVRGGERITEGVLFAGNTAKGTYSGYGSIDTTPSTKKTRAKYEWGSYFVTLSLAQTDELKVSGPTAVMSLLESEMESAELDMKDQLGDDIFTGEDEDGLVGLDSAINTTNTYGGISGTDFTWWVSTVNTTGHTRADLKTASSTSYILTLLSDAFANCTHNGSGPNLIITTWTVFGMIEAVLQAQAKYEQLGERGTRIAQSGFSVIQYRGVPIVADEKCADYHMYVLNTNFMKLYVHPDNDFKFSGFVKPANQMARVGQITWTGQLGIKSRRHFQKFTSLGAS